MTSLSSLSSKIQLASLNSTKAASSKKSFNQNSELESFFSFWFWSGLFVMILVSVIFLASLFLLEFRLAKMPRK